MTRIRSHQELARILRKMYEDAEKGRQKVAMIHLFGIKKMQAFAAALRRRLTRSIGNDTVVMSYRGLARGQDRAAGSCPEPWRLRRPPLLR